MEFSAITRYSRVSPRKAKLVADMIKTYSPLEALNVLTFIQKGSAASILKKTIATAIASVPEVNRAKLHFVKIEVFPGGGMKRFRSVSRGMAHSYKKRMSHIKVVLTDTKSVNPKSKISNPKQIQNANIKT